MDGWMDGWMSEGGRVRRREGETDIIVFTRVHDEREKRHFCMCAVCMYVCLCVYINTFVCVYVRMYVSMYAMHVCMYVCV